MIRFQDQMVSVLSNQRFFTLRMGTPQHKDLRRRLGCYARDDGIRDRLPAKLGVRGGFAVFNC